MKALEHIKFFTKVKKDLRPRPYKKMFAMLKLEEFNPGDMVFEEGNNLDKG
jgi:hypothetical protein